MRRRAKPGKTKVEAKLPVARKSSKNEASGRRELQKRLEEALKREAEALEQETATSEILRVISSSPTDVQPVFQTIAESAVRLSGALFGSVYRFDGELIHMVAHHNYPTAALEFSQRSFPAPPSRQVFTGRAILERAVVHVKDVSQDQERLLAQDLAEVVGFRSVLSVPMLREGSPIGAITVWRSAVGPFSDKHVALIETFADQAVIAIENVRLFKELEARNQNLTVALEQQTATSEILRVISSSPSDAQPVFEAIVANAARLCDATFSAVARFDGGLLHLVAMSNMSPEESEAYRSLFPRPPGRHFIIGRAFVDGRPVHVEDVRADPDYDPRTLEVLQRAAPYGTYLGIPILRDGVPIGAIGCGRREVKPFAASQIELVQTFADQAVIAIENVRLFTELQEKNRALTEAHGQVIEALEQQTATSEILRVISSSPTDVQPVFDTIARSAVRLCDASFGTVFQMQGDLLDLAAQEGMTERALEGFRAVWPMRPNMESIVGRAVLTGEIVHVEDAVRDPNYRYSSVQRAVGYRTIAAVPMVRETQAIGVIVTWRLETRPFSSKQITLLQTFADQAVIAIENVRLFTELQTSNRELTTALDQQTATSDILRVISRSQTNVQPVFDAIVERAVRLLRGYTGALTRVAGDQIELAAHTSTDEAAAGALRALFPRSLQSGGPAAQTIRDRAPVNIADQQTDPQVPEPVRAMARVSGHRSVVWVPLLRHDEAVGGIGVTRPEPGGFTDDEIALLQTFADQAVIAIENVRLFKELEARTTELTRSVGQLTALGEISQAVSSTLDVETVLQTIVSRASQLAGADGCAIYEYDEATEAFHIRATHNLDPVLVGTLRASPLRKGEGAMGRAAETREPTQVADIAAPGAYQSPIRDTLLGAGYRALLSVPLLREGEVIGSLSLNRRAPGEFPPEAVEVLKTFATQSALAVQNARLFREIADKSRQLEAASRHKSEFLANMSHELRTPLNAIIGFSEVLTERMFGELNEKQDEYLKDINASGQHLLSLINDILDLSKIEAGRMELEVADFDLPSAIDNALILVRERATRRGITLGRTIDEHLGSLRGDERKVKQVLLNLLSNALKFTPEGGRIDVSAGVHDEVAEVSVTDTGVGIAPADQEAVFEEFRQVGTADKKVEGTGLGLALSRKFIELHGGRIWVTSAVGVGSTFTFTLPVRRGD